MKFLQLAIVFTNTTCLRVYCFVKFEDIVRLNKEFYTGPAHNILANKYMGIIAVKHNNM